MLSPEKKIHTFRTMFQKLPFFFFWFSVSYVSFSPFPFFNSVCFFAPQRSSFPPWYHLFFSFHFLFFRLVSLSEFLLQSCHLTFVGVKIVKKKQSLASVFFLQLLLFPGAQNWFSAVLFSLLNHHFFSTSLTPPEGHSKILSDKQITHQTLKKRALQRMNVVLFMKWIWISLYEDFSIFFQYLKRWVILRPVYNCCTYVSVWISRLYSIVMACSFFVVVFLKQF